MPKSFRELIAEETRLVSRIKDGDFGQQGPLDQVRADLLRLHDERFAHGFVQIEGAPYPVSRALARRLGEYFPGTAYSVGDDAE